MPASRPKRRKLAAILLLLSGRTITELDINNDDSVFEQLLNQMCSLQPQMDVDEISWSSEQMAVWTKTEELDGENPDFKQIQLELEELIAAL